MLDVIPTPLGLSRLVRPLLVLGLVAGCTLLLARPMACGGETRPRGYHSPQVAYGDGELGLAWLNRAGKREQLVFARADGQNARMRGEPVVVSERAIGSAAPLIAWAEGTYVLLWTHHGEQEPGLYASTARGGRVQGGVRVLPEVVKTCTDLVATPGGFVTGAMDDDGVRLLQFKVQTDALPGTAGVAVEVLHDLGEHPLTADATAGAESCRLRYDGRNLRLVTTMADKRASLIVVPPAGEGITARALKEPYDVAALAVAGPHTMALLSDAAEGTAELRHFGSDLGDKSRTALKRKQHVRGLALENESGRYVAVFSESKGTEGLGTVSYALVEEGKGLLGPKRLSPAGRARAHVSTATQHGRVALVWSDVRDGGTVAWGILRVGGHDHGGAFHYEPGELPLSSFEVSRGGR